MICDSYAANHSNNMIAKVIVLLTIIHTISSDMVAVSLIDLLQTPKISISNRFKANEVILSHHSRQLAKANPSFKDLTQIPQLQVELSNVIPQKYFHIRGNIHAYVFRAVMGLEEFRGRFGGNSESGRYEVVLMKREHESQARKVINGSRLCFYQNTITQNEQLHQILRECLKHKQSFIEHTQTEQNGDEDGNELRVFTISLIACAVMTVGKLFKFRQLARKDSVV